MNGVLGISSAPSVRASYMKNKIEELDPAATKAPVTYSPKHYSRLIEFWRKLNGNN